MKKVCRIVLLVLLVSAGITKSNEAKSQTASVSFSVFYNSLKPYGRWEKHPKYGQVWISNTRDFRPYSTGGRWTYTDYGWTWVSNYDWGWAPFHYGRWAYESGYGWYWVPGYEWAPAWVAWRGGGDYYGWAPLSPGSSISVGVSFGNSIPYDRWVFAPHRYITSPYISRYYVPRSRNVTIIKNTTVVNNVTVKNNVHYVAGPRKEDVEKVNHTKLHTYTVANSSKPGKTVVNKNTVNVYRPVINNNDKTVVNKTTVNKNSNNTTVNKNSNNTTVNNKSTTVTKNSNKATTNNKTTTSKQTNKTTNQTVNKKPQQNKKPADNSSSYNNSKQKTKGAQHSNVAKTKATQDKEQQQKNKDEVAKRKNKNNNDDNNKRK